MGEDGAALADGDAMQEGGSDDEEAGDGVGLDEYNMSAEETPSPPSAF